MGALLIKPENVRLLELGLDQLMEEISSEHNSAILPSEEFHGTDLFSGKGIWRVITKGERYSLSDNPHRLALKFLIEKIDRKLEDFDSFGIIICDETGPALEKDAYRDLLREIQVDGTGGPYARKIVRIVDTLHFVSSKKSRGIQAIDLITFLHRRISVHTHASDAEYQFTQMLWGKVRDKVVYQRTWAP